MIFKNLTYYGYSRETYEHCKNMITDANLHNAKTLNIWFTILCLVVIAFSNGDLLLVMAGNPGVYLSYFFLALIWDIIIFSGKKHSALGVRIAVIMEGLFLLTFALYSSVVQPYMMAVMFPIVILVIAFSYIDIFYFISLSLIAASGILVLTSYIFKPLSIMYVDIYNLVIYLSLALVFHYVFQRARISRFVAFYENVNIQHDLEERSSFDALTGLLNRGRFFTITGEILRNRSPHPDEQSEHMAVCLFDLDGFKQINDRLGHQMGDKAIQMAGEKLLEGFSIEIGEKWSFEKRAVDSGMNLAGRLGGDEFIVLARGAGSMEQVIAKADGVLRQLEKVQIGELHGIFSSVGIAEIKETDKDIDSAYARADEALYQSKAAGKHTITVAKNDGGKQ